MKPMLGLALMILWFMIVGGPGGYLSFLVGAAVATLMRKGA